MISNGNSGWIARSGKSSAPPTAENTPTSVIMSSSINDPDNEAERQQELSSVVRSLDQELVEIPMARARTSILNLSILMGQLCSIILVADADDNADAGTVEMSNLLAGFLETASLLSINLHTSILKKMELNGKKYPVELCKGRRGKYTEYSETTGITKTTGQSTIDNVVAPSLPSSSTIGSGTPEKNASLSSSPSSNAMFWDVIPSLTSAIRQFAVERDWGKYHRPRSLTLALMGELGELAELLQFEEDNEIGTRSVTQLDKISQELADVSIYLLRLADVSNVVIVQQE